MKLVHRVIRQNGLGLLALAVIMASLMAACSSGAGAAGENNPLASLDPGQIEALGRGLGSVNAVAQGAGQGITAIGTGIVTIEPDLAVLSLGVEAAADTVGEARTQAAERINAMLAALEAAGVPEEDIETQRFQIRPEYQRYANESRISGFQVSNMLTIKVRNLESVGEVIDRAVEAGGDATRVNNINFTVEEGGEAEDQARRLALQDAVAKADLYAAEMGLSRGDLLSLTETSGSRFPETARLRELSFEDDGVRTTVLPGELDVVVHVEAVFAIER